jgi:hypothetical protein
MIRRLTRGVYAPFRRKDATGRSLARGIAAIGPTATVRLPPERSHEVTILKNLVLRYGLLAMLILAAGAGKKWR